jgi:hypothetical protein
MNIIKIIMRRVIDANRSLKLKSLRKTDETSGKHLTYRFRSPILRRALSNRRCRQFACALKSKCALDINLNNVSQICERDVAILSRTRKLNLRALDKYSKCLFDTIDRIVARLHGWTNRVPFAEMNSLSELTERECHFVTRVKVSGIRHPRVRLLPDFFSSRGGSRATC